MRLVVRPEVPRELQDLELWYDQKRAGLGRDFLREVDAAYSRIARKPFLYQAVHADIRRAAVRRFPYGVFYTLIGQEIHVLHVVADARHPSVGRRFSGGIVDS